MTKEVQADVRKAKMSRRLLDLRSGQAFAATASPKMNLNIPVPKQDC